MARCAALQSRGPCINFVEQRFRQVNGPEQLIVPCSAFFPLHGEVQRIHATAQIDGSVHQALVCLQTVQCCSRVVANASMPGLGVEAFQLPRLEHRLGLGGGLPPAGVQRIDLIDEGLGCLEVTRQGHGACGLLWPDGGDVVQAPPCHAMAGPEALNFLEIGFPIEQILRQGSAVQRQPVPLLSPTVQRRVQAIESTLKPVDNPADLRLKFCGCRLVTGGRHLLDAAQQALCDASVEGPHVAIHPQSDALKVVAQPRPRFEGIVTVKQGRGGERRNRQPLSD